MKKNVTISLKTILIVPFTALIIIIVGVIGYLSFLNGQKAVNNVAEQLQSEISKRIEDHLSAFLNLPQQINHINTISIQKGGLNASDATSLELHFWNQVKVFKSVSSIYFGNNQGGLVNSGREKNSGSQYIIVTDNFRNGPFKKFNTDALGNRKNLLLTVPNFDARKRQWYKGAVESGTEFWSPVYILFTGQDLAIAASRPAYDGKGNILGVMSIDLFLSHISSFLENLAIGKTGHAFIMEDSGLLIASSTGTKLFFDPEKGEKRKRIKAIESETPLIHRAAESLINKFEDFNNITTKQEIIINVDHQRYFLQVTPIKKNGLSWLISVIIPEKDFMSEIKEGNRLTAIFILLALMFVLFACILLARRITSPIFSLITSAQNLAKGKWKSKIGSDSLIFEVNTLTHSFNQMADQLQKSLNELHIEVNERKQTEEKLIERETYLRTVIETIPDLVWLKDPEGVYLSCNKKFERFFGAKEKDIVGKTDYDFVEKKLADFFREKDKIALQSGKPSVNEEEVVYADDGHIELLETLKCPMYNNEGTLIGVLGVGHDITERKMTELSLIENNELLTSFIQHSPIYCYIKEVSPEKSLVLHASENFDEMIGIKGTKMIGKTMDELFPSEFAAKMTADDWDVVSKGELLKFDENLNNRNYNTIKFPIVLGDKTLLAGYTIDITERNQAEAEKLMAQKIADEHGKQALIGRVAGKMAHDFNNILGIIMGNTELALIDCPDVLTKKKLSLIYDQTIRGKNLTKNLIAFAKDQEPKQEFFSFEKKIDLVFNLMKKDLDGIKIIRQYDHGIPELLADSGMIEHAIVNLVQNSIHAVSLVEQPQIIVRIYHQKDFIYFEIEDNGCGIPSDSIGDIYEPSFTLKGSKDKNGVYKSGIKGTGYGMSNVKRYIEQHMGNVSIHSELKKGTNITIKLPVTKKELTDEEIKDVKREIIYFEKNILLVEDEQAISDIQYSILTNAPCNHRVDVANTGQMAIDLLKKNKYDFISLDYVLPGNFNGMDIYHHIRERNTAIPVLFNSGNIEFLESIKELKKKDPYVDHLSKPSKNIDYLNCVNKLFRTVTI